MSSSAQFQKSGSGSIDAACVKISESIELKSAVENFEDAETYREKLQIARKLCVSRNWSFWFFTVLFLWALVSTGFCFGFFMGNRKEEGGIQGILNEIKSTLIDLRNETGYFVTSDLKSWTSEITESLQATVQSQVQGLEQTLNNNETRNAEVKGQIDDLEQKLSDLDLQLKEHGTQLMNKISSDHNKLEQKFGAQHEEINETLITNLDEVKGQLSDLDSNKTEEINSARDEVKRELSEVKDQIKSWLRDQLELQFMNFSSNFLAATTTTTAPPTLPAPRFYSDAEYRSASFAPSTGWENTCIEMPRYMDKQASSVKLEGHCLLICNVNHCESASLQNCKKIRPNSQGLDNFQNINFNDQVSSFRQCRNE